MSTFTKIVWPALLALVVLTSGGCMTTEGLIQKNNEFAVAKVNGACDALAAFPERYARCLDGKENAFLSCYEEKITARVMPSEALAICRVAVDSRGKVEPGLSANPRTGDERFGVNRGYGYGNYGYRDGYYNGSYGGYGGYNWPTNPTVVNRIGPMFTTEGPTSATSVNHQLSPQQPQATLQSRQCERNPDVARQMGINCR